MRTVTCHRRGWQVAQLVVTLVMGLTLAACASPATKTTATATPAPTIPTAYAVTASRADTGASLLYAIAARTGLLRWSVTLDGVVQEPPVTADGVVYVAGASPSVADPTASTLYALNATSGAISWSKQIPGGALSLFQVSSGLLIGVLAQSSSASITFQQSVVALSARDGSSVWSVSSKPNTALDPFAIASGMLYLTENQYTPTSRKGALIAVSLEDGAVQQLEPFSKSVKLVDGVTFVGALYADRTIYAGWGRRGDSYGPGLLLASNLPDMSFLWRYHEATGGTAQPVAVSGKTLYVYDTPARTSFLAPATAFMRAFNVYTGKLLWSAPAEAELANTYSGAFSWQAQSDGQAVYYASEKSPEFRGVPIIPGTTNSVIALSASDGSQRWKDLETQTVTPPTIWNGLVLVALPRASALTRGAPGVVEALNATDGSIQWSLAVEGAALAPMVVSG